VAEDKENKTEPATPRRRQEARESGQVARSHDLTGACLLLVGLLMLSSTAQAMIGSLAAIMRAMLGNEYYGSPAEVAAISLRTTAPHLFKALAPILLTVAGVALLSTGMQVGFHVSAKPIMPNLNKLNPLQGLGRLFGGQNVMQMVMNLAKTTVVAVIAWNEMRAQLPGILSLSDIPFPANFAVACEIIYNLAWRLAMALLLLAAADWLYQKWRLERDLRMTKQEIKDEAKRMDGDQQIKGRRRQLARKMIMQRVQRDVPKADVVITNPTELAIALKYDPETMAAPRVVAKGSGYLAARIRQIAIQNGVPILERKPLAQALYKTVEVGQDVPPEFYQAIAEILAFVYELAGKGMRRLRKAG
jgi:flagellar biosynthetic protein FlhB